MSQQLTPELQAILDATRRGIAEAETNLARLRAIEAAVLKVTGPAPTGKSARTPPDEDGQTMTIGGAAEKVLREAGGPLGTRGIAAAILAGGLFKPSVSEADFVNNVFSTLRRKDDVFVKTEPGIWDLVERRAKGAKQ